MNLTVLIPIWKRHDLTDLCFKHLKTQQKKFGFDVVVVGSEGESSKKLAINYGFRYVETENDPLGAKLNTGLSNCSGDVVVIGSDDFLSDSSFDFYKGIDSNQKIYAGTNTVLFYSTHTKKLCEYKYNGKNVRTIGAGRMYTKAMIDACGGKLWQDDKMKGMDMSASQICDMNGGKEILSNDFTVLDVKHSHNLTTHEVMKHGKQKDISEMGSLISDCVLDDLKSLSPSLEKPKTLPVRSFFLSKPRANMKRIKLLKDVGLFKEGQELSQPSLRAERLVKKGIAVYLSNESNPEKETAKAEITIITPKKQTNGG